MGNIPRSDLNLFVLLNGYKMWAFDELWLKLNQRTRVNVDLIIFCFVGYIMFILGLTRRVEMWLFYFAIMFIIVETEVTRTALKSRFSNISFVFTILFNILIIFSAFEYLITGRFVNNWLSFVGFFMVLLGLSLHVYVFNKLGKFYSDDIEIKKNHKLVTTGLYKYIRHPAYLGIFLGLFGLPLILNSFRAFPISIAASLVVFYKTLKEEDLLEKKISKYSKYKKNTGMFFPKVLDIKS